MNLHGCRRRARTRAGLVAAVLGMLGLEEKDVGEGETLESLGMDSMQVAEIRARLQRALGRPMPLEEARPLHTLFWPGLWQAARMKYYPAIFHTAVLGVHKWSCQGEHAWLLS